MSSTKDSINTPTLSAQTLPDELNDAQWVCWRATDDGKEAVNPATGEAIDSLSEGVTFDEAKRAVDDSNYEGLAFVVREDSNLIGIRLLDAINEVSDQCNVDDWAEKLIKIIDSYTEVGPAEDSILVLTEGSLPSDEFESEQVQFTSEGIVPITGNSLESFTRIHSREREIGSLYDEYNECGSSNSGDSVAEFDEGVTLSDVRGTVVNNFDEAQWHLTEAILSTHATLLVSDIQNCAGLIVVGQSGAGKTTALKCFEGLSEQFYRSDEVTPASFVTHDASLSEEELEDVDLLPRIKHKSLLCRDMETWFSGDRESIRTTMSRMTHLMDGEGLTRDSGSHGKRGYEGDFRFSFIGASTPLKSRAWDVMGNAGYRFVFYHRESRSNDHETVKGNLFDESSYEEKVTECRHKVQSFLHQLWNDHGGYGSIPNDEISFSDDAQDAIAHLAKLVQFSRATLTDGSGKEDHTVRREDPLRVGAVLREIAKGRALIDGETEVDVDDVVVSARVALSTMPNKRRPIVRALLNPANDGQLTRNEVGDALGVSKPTALNRMKLVDTLGIAEFTEVENDGRGTKKLELKEEFQWPEVLSFPDR
jgi:energy-coupling factor transporter ATP-binding protein EcfA2